MSGIDQAWAERVIQAMRDAGHSELVDRMMDPSAYDERGRFLSSFLRYDHELRGALIKIIMETP
jgi:hypothetical protein